MKILWVDDQIEVITTFKEILKPLCASITTVKDGIEAKRKIMDEYYDLIISDLMMPPDKWGGLWLLEELEKECINVPVIILSSEGSQKETIIAMRLGAIDYVLKENVESELMRCVLETIRKSGKIVINELNSIVAIPYKRYLAATNPTSKLKRFIEAIEIVIKYITIIRMCEDSNIGKINSENSVVNILKKPSVGGWNQLRKKINDIDKQSVHNKLNKLLDAKPIDELIQIRNDIAHGVEPSEKVANELLVKYNEVIDTIVREISRNTSIRMILPQGMKWDGNNYNIEGYSVSGDSISLPRTILLSNEPLLSNEVYLVNERENKYIKVHPYILLEPSNEPSAWNILIYDGIKCNHNTNLIKNEKLKYTEVWSGKRVDRYSERINSDLILGK